MVFADFRHPYGRARLSVAARGHRRPGGRGALGACALLPSALFAVALALQCAAPRLASAGESDARGDIRTSGETLRGQATTDQDSYAKTHALEVGAGFDFSSGDYGSSPATDVYYAPLLIAYEYGAWRAELTVPYLSIDGPSDAVSAGPPGARQQQPLPPQPEPESDVTSESSSGIGDVLIGLRYGVEALWNYGWFVDVTGTAKVPTADEDDGLGTGEFDFLLELDVAKTLGRWTPLLGVGYRFTGKTDVFDTVNAQGVVTSEVDLRDTLFGSAGVQFSATPHLVAGAIYEYRQSIARGSSDPQEIFSYLYYDIDGSWAATLYGIAGLSQGSPDYGVGTVLTYRFDL